MQRTNTKKTRGVVYVCRDTLSISTLRRLRFVRNTSGNMHGSSLFLPQLFKAAEFVHKHLINKHPDKHKAVVDQVW